jgi:hypothetical protein
MILTRLRDWLSGQKEKLHVAGPVFRRADVITRLSQSPWSPYLDEFVTVLGA